MRSGRYLVSFRDSLKIIKDQEEITLANTSGTAIVELEDFDFMHKDKIRFLSTSKFEKPDFYVYKNFPKKRY